MIVGSQANGYMNKVTWTCNPGYIFPDITFSKTITCQSDRTWSEIPDQCISKSIYIEHQSSEDQIELLAKALALESLLCFELSLMNLEIHLSS